MAMDKLREDFEADFENETGWSSGEYPSQDVVDLCWRLYQQSRSSIVVDLPDQMTEVVADTLIHGRVMANDMRTACAKAIRSIGLPIKGE